MPRLLDLPTATAIRHRTTTVFTTRHHLPTLLILSFFLFSLRHCFESLTLSLTTYYDNDPYIKSHFPPKPTTTTYTHRHRRNDPLITKSDDLDPRFFNTTKPNSNHTPFVLKPFDHQPGLSGFVSDNGIMVSEIVRAGFKIHFRDTKILEKEVNTSELGLTRFDLTYPASLLMLFAYLAIHVWVHGVVFVLVVNDLLNVYAPVFMTLHDGAVLGARRLSWFVLIRWAHRQVLALLVGLYFFWKLIFEDRYTFNKIFVRLKVVPFSIDVPWTEGFDKEINGFLLYWYLLDMVLSFVLALCPWVAMEDPTRTIEENLQEELGLLLLRFKPAVVLYFDGIVCGTFGKIVLTHFFGRVFASFILSFVEVYFLVAWVLHYFSAKSLVSEKRGMPFGNADIEAMLQHG